jgi:hypothetical protein
LAAGWDPLGLRDEVCRLLVPEVDVVAEHIDVEELPDILATIVA